MTDATMPSRRRPSWSGHVASPRCLGLSFLLAGCAVAALTGLASAHASTGIDEKIADATRAAIVGRKSRATVSHAQSVVGPSPFQLDVAARSSQPCMAPLDGFLAGIRAKIGHYTASSARDSKAMPPRPE